MDSTQIALDVMGGDSAPHSTLVGALQACEGEGARRLPPERLLLVGDEPRIREELERIGATREGPVPDLAVRHASQAVAMDESPSSALRSKPDSSIAVCVGAVKSGEAAAMVSMGNTGAVVGSATLGLRTLTGVRRPGIAVTLGFTGRRVTLLDMGANIDPKPEHLLQYGLMGAVFARECLDVLAPRIGLLNIGEEASKGTSLLKSAHGLLEASRLDFVGNVEGGDLFGGIADVVVTDGFTGNVVLKLLESTSALMIDLVLGELRANGVDPDPAALQSLERKVDYSEVGGALLLGVAGVVVIGHGRSDANAVANALCLAGRALDAGVNTSIEEGVERAAREGVA
ncbi:MAG: phosphate acyltransferase PlsX [Planctomycetota bacterium]|jgi:glycerol-3-phosphate acyltransferase PlsX|nr:phosphate acyltransferase PlsX [Planctomycetota bacterium]MDP6762326.1 phosphate acyltransferase PlsX [Planctomycetota bacterium]MDP6989749.1 phosphate acyltransferase PlsX [Planctomycetota bacterium]